MANPSAAQAQYGTFTVPRKSGKTTTTTTTAPKNTAGPKTLPFTGYNLELAVLVAVVFVAVGLTLVFASRRFKRN